MLDFCLLELILSKRMLHQLKLVKSSFSDRLHWVFFFFCQLSPEIYFISSNTHSIFINLVSFKRNLREWSKTLCLVSKLKGQEKNKLLVLFFLHTFSLITSWITRLSLETLVMTSDVLLTCKSKYATSCLNTALRYLTLILAACLSPVLVQQ